MDQEHSLNLWIQNPSGSRYVTDIQTAFKAIPICIHKLDKFVCSILFQLPGWIGV